MQRAKLLLAGLATGVVLLTATGVAASDEAIEKAIGMPLTSVDAVQAAVMVNRYAEGRILVSADRATRIKFLGSVRDALPQGSDAGRRAQLLLESVETSTRP